MYFGAPALCILVIVRQYDLLVALRLSSSLLGFVLKYFILTRVFVWDLNICSNDCQRAFALCDWVVSR
jgi:hypothetical protein